MNILIVESKNDKAFFQYLLQAMGISLIPVTIFGLDEIDGIRGLSPEALRKALITNINSLTNGVRRDEIPMLGILIDVDEQDKGDEGMKGGINNRLTSINTIITEVLGTNPSFTKMCTDIRDFVQIEIETKTLEKLLIKVGCHFTNIEGRGNLDTLQMAIAKKENAHIANCLEEWKKCYQKKLETGLIDDKYQIKKIDSEYEKLWVNFCQNYDNLLSTKSIEIFEKQWVNFYKKYDTLDANSRGNSGKRNAMETMLKERGLIIFDFNSPQQDFQNLLSFLK
jgi:hypothetical protein